METLGNADLWLCAGVALGWVLGICTMVLLWWLDGMAASALHRIDQERCECGICRGDTRHGDAVTHDDTYPWGGW